MRRRVACRKSGGLARTLKRQERSGNFVMAMGAGRAQKMDRWAGESEHQPSTADDPTPHGCSPLSAVCDTGYTLYEAQHARLSTFCSLSSRPPCRRNAHRRTRSRSRTSCTRCRVAPMRAAAATTTRLSQMAARSRRSCPRTATTPPPTAARTSTRQEWVASNLFETLQPHGISLTLSLADELEHAGPRRTTGLPTSLPPRHTVLVQEPRQPHCPQPGHRQVLTHNGKTESKEESRKEPPIARRAKELQRAGRLRGQLHHRLDVHGEEPGYVAAPISNGFGYSLASDKEFRVRFAPPRK